MFLQLRIQTFLSEAHISIEIQDLYLLNLQGYPKIAKTVQWPFKLHADISCWYLRASGGCWWIEKGTKSYGSTVFYDLQRESHAYGQVRVNAFIVLRRQSSCRGTTHPAPSLGLIISTVNYSWNLGLEKAFFCLSEDLVVEFVLESMFGKRFWSRSLDLVLKNVLTNIFCFSKYLIEKDTFAW